MLVPRRNPLFQTESEVLREVFQFFKIPPHCPHQVLELRREVVPDTVTKCGRQPCTEFGCFLVRKPDGLQKFDFLLEFVDTGVQQMSIQASG